MSTLNTLKMINVTLIMTRMGHTELKLPLIAVLDFSGSPGLAMAFLRSRATRMMTSLKVLRMAWCGITSFPQSIQEQKVPNITHLDLSHNPLRCTCELSWISNFVREGKLTLENEQHTICANPIHLQNIPLLTATLCPFVRTLSTMNVPESTVSTVETFSTRITPTQVFPEWSTELSGKSWYMFYLHKLLSSCS